MTANEALERLKEGNRRFVSGIVRHPNESLSRRKEVVAGQSPIAVLLACSDSRLVPTVMFDCGIGDIFIVRVAGNVLDDVVIASIEYAVAVLNTSLVIVKGHECCGAVRAAMDGEPVGHINVLIEKIKPACENLKDTSDESWKMAILSNIRLVTEKLKATGPILSEAYKSGKINILPAYYHLHDGKVDFLE